jgi:hypothetical protein
VRQGHQQMLGGVVEFGVGQQAIKSQPPQLPQPDGHTPRLVAGRYGADRDALQALQSPHAAATAVEEKGEVFWVCRLASQAGPTVDGSGDVDVDSHARLPSLLCGDCNTGRDEGQKRIWPGVRGK